MGTWMWVWPLTLTRCFSLQTSNLTLQLGSFLPCSSVLWICFLEACQLPQEWDLSHFAFPEPLWFMFPGTLMLAFELTFIVQFLMMILISTPNLPLAFLDIWVLPSKVSSVRIMRQNKTDFRTLNDPQNLFSSDRLHLGLFNPKTMLC